MPLAKLYRAVQRRTDQRCRHCDLHYPSSTLGSNMYEICGGCGAEFAIVDGPVHAYMTSSPSCFSAYTTLLAIEYSNAAFVQTHRLSIDAYAVQHPGNLSERRCIQSVGLHLSRLYLQLAHPLPPQQTNETMLDLSRHKSSLTALKPPAQFRATVASVLPFAGTVNHTEKVRVWAIRAWEDWYEHHAYIRHWIHEHSRL
jgi:Family of unknown function (DUF5946)